MKSRRSFSPVELFRRHLRWPGVSNHKATTVPRGKPSGLPFKVKLSDIASSAGLRNNCIYGDVDRKTYILEAIGCSCAFFDFDNDGWVDIAIGRKLNRSNQW
jgi:hypothetical protein